MEQYSKNVLGMLQDYYGEDAEVTLRLVSKNNGRKLHGITVLKKGSGIGPTFYLEDVQEVERDPATAARMLIALVEEQEDKMQQIQDQVRDLLDYEKVRSRLYCKVISYARNRALLKEVPYVRFLDLAMVFYLEANIGRELGAILVRREQMEAWQVEVSELQTQAVSNMELNFNLRIRTLWDTVEELSGMSASEAAEAASVPIYVATNRENCYGASLMLIPRMLQQISEQYFDHESFYILPSSVHELILVGCECDTESQEQGLQTMVREVNEQAVEAEAFLSNHVYRYDAGKDCLCITKIRKAAPVALTTCES